jgi:hypothetical protein
MTDPVLQSLQWEKFTLWSLSYVRVVMCGGGTFSLVTAESFCVSLYLTLEDLPVWPTYTTVQDAHWILQVFTIGSGRSSERFLYVPDLIMTLMWPTFCCFSCSVLLHISVSSPVFYLIFVCSGEWSIPVMYWLLYSILINFALFTQEFALGVWCISCS